MRANAAAVGPARAVEPGEVIKDFDAVILRAPFFLRCGAAIIDYLLIVIVPVLGLLIGRLLGNDGARLVSSDLNNIAWMIALLVGLCNSLLLPVVTGQSLGKMITGLRIVTVNGSSVPLGSMLFRQTLGYLIVFLTGGLGFILSVFGSKGRGLHDLVSGTVVVFARTEVRS